MISRLRRHSRRVAATALALGLGAVASDVGAQERAPYLTQLGVPAAATLPGGSGFAQVTYTNDRNGTGLGADGSSAFGLGFGDLRSGFGAQAVVELTSLRSSFADSGFLSVQGATRLRRFAAPSFLALGVDRIVAWGDATAGDPSASLIFTTFPNAGTGALPVMLTGGLRLQRAAVGTAAAPAGGGGDPPPQDPKLAFAPARTASAVSAGSSVGLGDYELGLFGAIGVGLGDQVAASAAWNVDHAVLGVSYRPRQMRNLAVSLSVVDPFGQVGNARLALSVSYLFGSGL